MSDVLDVNDLDKLGYLSADTVHVSSLESSVNVKLTEPHKNVVSIEVSKVYIPKTEYTIESSNNTLKFSIGSTNSQTVAVIPSGDYTVYTLSSIIAAKTLSYLTIDTSRDYEHQLLLETTHSSGINIDLDNSTCTDVLGLTGSGILTITPAQPCIADNICNLKELQTVTIHTNYDSLITKSNSRPHTLCYVRRSTDTVTPYTRNLRYFSPIASFDRLEIELRNENGEIYNLRGRKFHIDFVLRTVNIGKSWDTLSGKTSKDTFLPMFDSIMNRAFEIALQKQQPIDHIKNDSVTNTHYDFYKIALFSAVILLLAILGYKTVTSQTS